jgi:putative flippase GtrA
MSERTTQPVGSTGTVPRAGDSDAPREFSKVAPADPGPLLAAVKNDKIAFVIVGVANTIIGALWFVLFELTVGIVAGYMLSLLLAHIAAVLCAFVLYRTLVFRVRGNVVRDLVRFEMVYLSALAINAIALPTLVELGGLAPIPAQLLIVPVTAVISYVGHKYFSFRRGRGPA